MLFFRLLLLTLLLASAPSWADRLAANTVPNASVSGIALPLTKTTAAELAHIKTRGKVLSVDKQRQNNHVFFRVKVLHNNGKVKNYRIDRDSGQVQ